MVRQALIRSLRTLLVAPVMLALLAGLLLTPEVLLAEESLSELHAVFKDDSFSRQRSKLFHKLKQLEPLEKSLQVCLTSGNNDAKHYCIELLGQEEVINSLSLGKDTQRLFDALAIWGIVQDSYDEKDKLLAARTGELFTALAKQLCDLETRLPCKKSPLYPFYIKSVFERLFAISPETNSKDIKYNRARFSAFSSVLYFSYPHSEEYMSELARHPDPRVRFLAAQTLSLKFTKIKHESWTGEPFSKFEKNLAYNLGWDSDPSVSKKASFGRKWSD